MKDATPTGGIKQLLKQALECVARLHNALREEHAALTSNNLTAFEISVEQKLQHTSELEQVEQQLFSLLRNAGYRWDKQGLTDYVASLSSPSERKTILRSWGNLRQAIVECQQQNQINGRVLNLASVNIRQALNILTGQDSQSKTYSADGKPDKDGKTAIAVA